VRHLWLEKKFECIKSKATFKFFFQRFWGFLMPFCFHALVKGKKSIHLLFFYFLLLETAPKTQNISKFTKEQEMFAKWFRDGVQHINSIKTG
jgi:hypothetical protein